MKYLLLFVLLISLVSAGIEGQIGLDLSSDPVSIVEGANYSINVNQSDYWDTNIGSLGGVNSTQFENQAGDLGIKTSWLETFINALSKWTNYWSKTENINLSNTYNITNVKYLNANITNFTNTYSENFYGDGTYLTGLSDLCKIENLDPWGDCAMASGEMVSVSSAANIQQLILSFVENSWTGKYVKFNGGTTCINETSYTDNCLPITAASSSSKYIRISRTNRYLNDAGSTPIICSESEVAYIYDNSDCNGTGKPIVDLNRTLFIGNNAHQQSIENVSNITSTMFKFSTDLMMKKENIGGGYGLKIFNGLEDDPQIILNPIAGEFLFDDGLDTFGFKAYDNDFDKASIISSTGEITFGDNDLDTTGNISAEYVNAGKSTNVPNIEGTATLTKTTNYIWLADYQYEASADNSFIVKGVKDLGGGLVAFSLNELQSNNVDLSEDTFEQFTWKLNASVTNYEEFDFLLFVNSINGKYYSYNDNYYITSSASATLTNDLIYDVYTGNLDNGWTDTSLTSYGTGGLVGRILTSSQPNIDHNSLANIDGNEHIDWTDATKNFKTTGKASFTELLGNTLINGDITISNAKNIILNTGTGTKIGTATNQKLGFFNANPVVQQTATTDLGVVLSNLGLRAVGTAYPITTTGAISGGSLTTAGNTLIGSSPVTAKLSAKGNGGGTAWGGFPAVLGLETTDGYSSYLMGYKAGTDIIGWYMDGGEDFLAFGGSSADPIQMWSFDGRIKYGDGLSYNYDINNHKVEVVNSNGAWDMIAFKSSDADANPLKVDSSKNLIIPSTSKLITNTIWALSGENITFRNATGNGYANLNAKSFNVFSPADKEYDENHLTKLTEPSLMLDSSGKLEREHMFENEKGDNVLVEDFTKPIYETITIEDCDLSRRLGEKCRTKEIQIIVGYEMKIENSTAVAEMAFNNRLLVSELNQKILVLQSENTLIKSELCIHNNKYSWCKTGDIK